MSNPLFSIYRINGSAVDVIPVLQIDNVLSGGAGTWDEVCRVDFFNPDGTLLCVFPCAAGSTVVVGNVSADFNLLFVHQLGTPNVAANKMALTGTLAVNGSTAVFSGAGAEFDNQPIVPFSGQPSSGYEATFTQVASQDPVFFPGKFAASPVPPFPQAWSDFAFGVDLLYRIRTVTTGTQEFPVFTIERTISPTDQFGYRSLPGPFSIPVALREAGAGTNPLRVVQFPVDDWLLHTTGFLALWNIDITGFQPGTISYFWQHSVVNGYLGALLSVSDGEVLSLLPRFNPNDQAATQLLDANWRLRRQYPSQNDETLTLQMLGPLEGTGPVLQPVAASCDGLNTHSGTGLVLQGTMVNQPPNDATVSGMGFSLQGAVPTGDTLVRLGSVDLNFDPAPSGTVGVSLSCTVFFDAGFGDFWIPRISVEGTLALQDIQPGGQDDPADPQLAQAIAAVAASGSPPLAEGSLALEYQRDSAVLISVPSAETATKNLAGTVDIRESSASGLSQQLTLTVSIQTALNTASNEIIIIDRQPFTVALVQVPNLASTASAETSEVAVWSNTFPEGPGWRVSAGAGAVNLLLPPQGIGEAMVTGLDIPGEPVDPQPSQTGQAIDFRLSPPAQVSMQSSNLVQRYAEPGWNLRRILGYPGEQAPGASLSNLQFEMLYGLTCTVSTSGLRMSEMFSRLGGFAGPLVTSSTGQLTLINPVSANSPEKSYVEGYVESQNTEFMNLNSQWAAIYRELLSRLGIYEPWNQIAGFDLTLSDGVTYDVRSAADIAAPGDTGTAKLHGGLAYALDDPNLYTELMSSPHASSATLINPRFSALGGYGKQRAGFANDKIIVESEVFMGALDTLTVTLIGRIGNLWHHAKHITVYKRTVRAARQFYLEQPALDGRAVLRKVSEYVEIVQKTRAYPESGSPLQCGFLQGVEFKSIRINVDSLWGHDVGDFGWCVPLWRRDAAPPDVYPRPQVVMQMAIDPATGNSVTTGEILDPEKLYFYTDTQSTTGSNTDLWAAVESVDYYNAPPLRSIVALLPPPTGQTTTAPVSDFSAEAGFGRFTYSVGPEAAQVNVVSQRTSNAMAVAMKSVSFMRAQSGQPAPAANDLQLNAAMVHDFVNNAIDAVSSAVAAVSANPTPQQIQDAISKRLGGSDITDHLLPTLKNAVGYVSQANTSKLCGSVADAAQAAFNSAAASFGSIWESLIDQAESQLTSLVQASQTQEDSLKQALLSNVDAIFLDIKSSMGLLLADLSVAGAVNQALLDGCTRISDDLTALQTNVTDAGLAVSRLPYTATATRCRDDLNTVVDDIQQVLDSASYLFGSAVLGKDVLASVKSALNDFSAAINGGAASVLASLVSSTAAVIQGQIGTLITLIKPPPTALTGALTTLANDLNAVSGSANQLLAGVNSLRQSLIANIQAVTATTIQAYVDAITTAFNVNLQSKFNALMASTSTNIHQQVQQACATLLADVGQLATNVANLLNGTALADEVGSLLGSGNDYAQAFDSLRANYTAQLDGLVDGCRQIAVANGFTPNNNGLDTGLSLLRAFGAPPQVPSLSLSLPAGAADAIAYFYTDLQDDAGTLASSIVQAVSISAGVQSALAQGYSALGQGADQLKQLAIGGMPTTAVLDRLIPDVSDLDLSSLFPNIGGLSLDNLFNGVTVPDVANDNIHISHKIDPQTLRAAADLTMNFPIAQSETVLFSIGPATISVENCTFAAAIHVADQLGQAATRTSTGSITADWHVSIGGMEIVSFIATALTFDESGHLHFDIQPARVQLAAVLEFLADFLQGIGLGGGFNLNLLPTGIQCVLALPFPDMSFGAFGISNLALGCLFELDILPTFAITVGANLGTKDAPFALTIFVLGGAGWFEASMTYTPGTGQLSADVSVGILASAILSISLGPVSGGVYIYFGIVAEFHSGQGLNIGILIMIQGRVSLLGFIDIDLNLSLEADYSSGGGLIGHGEVDVSIKICWCFTLSVHQSVTFTFGSSSGSSQKDAARSNMAIAAIAGATPTISPTQPYAQAATNRINFLT